MDWGDLTLRLVRAVGALAGAAAGIAALLTDGAFEKRQQPLRGWWRDFPLARYRVTGWGGTLLAVILIAPTIQFVGDWIKDHNDAITLGETATSIRQDIDKTVASTTERARQDIVKIVHTESQLQTEAAAKVSAQVTEVASGARQILTDVDRNLQPLGNPNISITFTISCKSPRYISFCAAVRQFVRKFLKDHPRDPNNATPIPISWSLFPEQGHVYVPLFLMVFKYEYMAEQFLKGGCLECSDRADLSVEMTLDNYWRPKSLSLYASIFGVQGRYYLEALDRTFRPEINSGKIISFSDLGGATLVLVEGHGARIDLDPLVLYLKTPTGQSVRVESFAPRVIGEDKVFLAKFPNEQP